MAKLPFQPAIISSFLNNLNDDKNISLETKENILRLYTQNSEANIKTLSPDDFPTIPLIDKVKYAR